MEFLKDILGEELFKQISEKINAHNENEENKDNQIKLANLGSGQYVSKDKFNNKDAELSNKVQELLEANNLIADLKNETKDNENLQKKITDYDTQIATLQAQVEEAKLKAAIKVALLSEKALDVDYLTFKLNEKLAENGETLQLDENENIKGWKDKIDGLKIQFPTQFETTSSRKIEEHKLEKPDNINELSRKDILKMTYAERNAFANENPDAYEQAMGR